MIPVLRSNTRVPPPPVAQAQAADGSAHRARHAAPAPTLRTLRIRILVVAGLVALFLASIAVQLVRLSLAGWNEVRTAAAETITRTFSRPDIVDRNGRIVATDIAGHSLYADPAMLLDADEATEMLVRVLPGLDARALRPQLADRSRRFVWIRRGLTPLEAQTVHDLGLPGLGFRREPKRVYPSGLLVGHIIGQVNPDNEGIAGLELYLDENMRANAVQAAPLARGAPLRLSLDLGVQHALADELGRAAARFQAAGAAGAVMDANSGEVLAAYSWPPIDPNVPGAILDATRPDRVQGGVYELGSIFKAFTVAMMLEDGLATLDKPYDVSRPLTFGRHTIRDLHPRAGSLTVRDVFVRSSNVGAGLMALEAGRDRQRAFLAGLGLTRPMRTEAGPVAPPLLPDNWGEVETATIAFGHGMAVAPMQVLAASAALVNGGHRVTPTFLTAPADQPAAAQRDGRVLSATTSDAIREAMRLNVTLPYGSGRRAHVPGYRVGGKTGTAEIPSPSGYRETAVISSFLATFPTDRPRYVLLVSLFEPRPAGDDAPGISAGFNAAPVTAAVVQRIAPVLGVLPRRVGQAR